MLSHAHVFTLACEHGDVLLRADHVSGPRATDYTYVFTPEQAELLLNNLPAYIKEAKEQRNAQHLADRARHSHLGGGPDVEADPPMG